MGQYWLLVNLTKGEYVIPTGGIKLLEIAWTPEMMVILTGLLADDCNGKGNGDFRGDYEYIGRWAGDRVIFTGDYGEPGQNVERVAKALGKRVTEDDLNLNLYEYIRENGVDISEEAYKILDENK